VNNEKQQLSEIVGAENVLDNPEILEECSKDESYATPLRPWFVVRPKNQEEVQALVQWANRTEIPLVPVSSGPPHFHGGTVPSAPQAVIVDLRRMNAIKRIDRRNRMAVIEPGVTYSQLEPALAKEGLRISHPLRPRGNKSVLASLLEKQPTLIPRFNFAMPDPLRTCGVVWGTGEIAYTGEAGGGKPLSLEAQWKGGAVQAAMVGPASSDLLRLMTAAQGSMGIATWGSVKCELIPEVHKYFFVAADELTDLIDFCYMVERIRLGDEVLVFNGVQLAAAMAVQRQDLQALSQAFPKWAVVIGLAGAGYYPQERVVVQEKQLRSLADHHRLKILDALPGISNAQAAKAIDSVSGEPSWKLLPKGGCQDIFFLTTLDKAPSSMEVVFSVAAGNQFDSSKIGIYIQPQHCGTSQHVEFSFFFDPADQKEQSAVQRIYTAASRELAVNGAYFSRPYGQWADLVYSRATTATRLLRGIKQIVDPKNVLNPGKLCF
jgi:hypothetical protein